MRSILLYLLMPLCVLPPEAAPTHAANKAPLSFTIETRDKVVGFLQPIVIRVVLRNNSQSSISLDTSTLRLHHAEFHVVGTWGQWSDGGEGNELDAEDKPAGRVELSPGASLRLLTVHKSPTFELLGPTRIRYKLSSTDTATNNLLPEDAGEVSLDMQPTKVMTSVLAANSQAERERSQASFIEFLRFWPKTEAPTTKEAEETDFEKQLTNDDLATKTVFFLAGYALPFLTDAMRDTDPFIRAQAVLTYPYAAGAIDQFDAYFDALAALGPRPQWALALERDHNKDQT